MPTFLEDHLAMARFGSLGQVVIAIKPCIHRRNAIRRRIATAQSLRLKFGVSGKVRTLPGSSAATDDHGYFFIGTFQ
jgi:hypothetical protein